MAKKNTDIEILDSTPSFVKEVGKYFLDFLETDFHKRKLPRRSIKLHNEKGLLTGLNISKYPSFYKTAYKLLNNAFSDGPLTIQKGVYKADIPKSLLDLIKKHQKLRDLVTKLRSNSTQIDESRQTWSQ